MPTFQTLSLADGQTTPVNQTFIPMPRAAGSNVFRWRANAIGEIAAGAPGVSSSFQEGNTKFPVDRIKASISVPLVRGNATDGYTVIGINRVRIEADVHLESTEQEKLDTIAYVSRLLSGTNGDNGIVYNAINSRSAVW